MCSIAADLLSNGAAFEKASLRFMIALLSDPLFVRRTVQGLLLF